MELFSSYLSNRQQYVVVDDVKSNFENICTGVPQGSILGPLLFIIYVNVIHSASSLFKFIIYADDTTLFSTLSLFQKPTGGNISLDINLELDKVNIWLKVNKLSLNIGKTKFMLFYKPQKQINIPCLKIENTEIDCVDEFNFLGLYLDKHINWNKHTQIVSSKVSQVIGIMYKLKGYVPQSIIQTIYNSLIVPRLNYCLLAWGYNFD